MSAPLEIQLRGKLIRFDPFEDHYPSSYYSAVENDHWEPHTVAFLERHLNAQKVLIDVGAATGVTALFAAALGARVVAFEPNPFVFASLERNTELNSVADRIDIRKVALSDHSATIRFNADDDPEVISSITVTGGEAYRSVEVEVVEIAEVLMELDLPHRENVVMKMDVEGAEYRILLDEKSVATISKKCGVLTFSLHPGFTHKRSRFSSLRKLQAVIGIFRTFRANLSVFKMLSAHGSLEIYGMRRATRPLMFAVLVQFGMHDWVFTPR